VGEAGSGRRPDVGVGGSVVAEVGVVLPGACRRGSWRCGWGCGVRGRWVWTRVVVVGLSSEGGGDVPGVGGGQWGRCRTCGKWTPDGVEGVEQAAGDGEGAGASVGVGPGPGGAGPAGGAGDSAGAAATGGAGCGRTGGAAREREIGAALRRLLEDEGIAAQGVGALVDLTVGEVRRLTRAVPAAVGEGQLQTAGGAAGGTGAGGHLAAVPPLEGCK